MYVKVEHFNGHGEYTVYEMRREVTTGSFFSTEQPDPQDILGFDHDGFSAEWKDQSSGAKGHWNLRYAWWTDENGLIHAVITKGRIYLLSDQGKTIDRV
jgi:hypothetical protein